MKRRRRRRVGGTTKIVLVIKPASTATAAARERGRLELKSWVRNVAKAGGWVLLLRQRKMKQRAAPRIEI